MKTEDSLVMREAKKFVVNIKTCEGKNYVYIGRPGPWGNPFIVGKDGNRDEVIKKYNKWLGGQPELIAKVKKKLKGKTLGCYCSPLSCHGHILAMVANDITL